MEISYLDRGVGRIAYDVQGEGPLVVAVPGMGDLRSVYRFLAPQLVAAGFRVATMDLRGHGDSDDGFPAYDGVAAGTDVLALVEHLGGGPALLIGNSMAAGAVTWAAAEKPDVVAGLVLTGAFVRNPKLNPLMGVLMKALLVKPWGPGAWKAYYKSLYPGNPPADLDQHLASIAASMRRGDHWRSFVQTTRTSHAPAEARLSEVHAPTLVIMGEKDRDWPDAAAEGRFVADALGGELIVVPNAGHYPMAEYPEQVGPAVLAFAQRVHAGA
ncbi:alpha/beta fold hydrolase [Cryptosporangium aurantiacum]|uniref:Pimeloyl-ACP methyl ester carboxylesterase n=1 Tax=Cryptosporangium aurantiacum TaxID=134849 RepID=A0A1M7MFW5_9ACTN|nr:alpha/beta hydrolase [Cryptosporangium aurantiacum]SHM89820.1 Pimeloyl-ACP methyl ester carboxylesterase [Cryptosporangium aurantiacum]